MRPAGCPLRPAPSPKRRLAPSARESGRERQQVTSPHVQHKQLLRERGGACSLPEASERGYGVESERERGLADLAVDDLGAREVVQWTSRFF